MALLRGLLLTPKLRHLLNSEGLLSEADLMKFRKKIALTKERIKQGLGKLGETPIKGPDVPGWNTFLAWRCSLASMYRSIHCPRFSTSRDQRSIYGAHSGSTHSGSSGYSVSVVTPSLKLPSVLSSALEHVSSPRRSGGTRVLESAHSTDSGSDDGPIATRAQTHTHAALVAS